MNSTVQARSAWLAGVLSDTFDGMTRPAPHGWDPTLAAAPVREVMPAGWDEARARTLVAESVAELASQQSPRHPLRQAAPAVRNHGRRQRTSDYHPPLGRLVAHDSPSMVLPARQVQIIVLVAQGFSNEEVGRLLHIHLDTVKTHLRRLYRAVGAKDRAHAVAILLRAGVLRWERP